MYFQPRPEYLCLCVTGRQQPIKPPVIDRSGFRAAVVSPNSRLLSLQPGGHTTRDPSHGGTGALNSSCDRRDTVSAHGRALQGSKGAPRGHT